MIKRILLTILFTFLTTSYSFAVNYCNDANNVGCFLMEDSGTETDRGGNTSNDMTVQSYGGVGDGIIPRNTSDFKFGSSSRDFEDADREALTQASDGLETEITGDKISMVGWIKVESFGDQHAMMAKFNQSGGQSYKLAVNTDGSVACYINAWPSGVEEALTPTSEVGIGVWHHLACVYNGTDIRIYVDGSLASNSTNNPKSLTGNLSNEDWYYSIGARYGFDVDADQVDGLMDDLGIFNRELSSSEINDIITNGLLGASGGGGGGGSSRERWIIVE